MKLEVRNVSLKINGKIIVENVSLSIMPGEIVGLLGPNGAGKTSTFNLLVGNLKPDKGDILINNKFRVKSTIKDYKNNIRCIIANHI